MKLLSFSSSAGPRRLGALRRDAQQVVDLGVADPALPTDLVELAVAPDDVRDRALRLIADPPQESVYELDAVSLAPPTSPSKVLAIGLNYRDHASEVGMEVPDELEVFAKAPSSLVGANQPIVLPSSSESVDAEAELAVVIGHRTRSVPEAQAIASVAGYTILNDVSARDWQDRARQWTLAKSFDSFGPVGPVLVTTDEVADPQALAIKLTINDAVYQDSNTGQMVLGVAELVSRLSAVLTLEPGDIISTGTPAGVGISRQPPRTLRAGDSVSIEVESIGTLHNPVVASDQDSQAQSTFGRTDQRQ